MKRYKMVNMRQLVIINNKQYSFVHHDDKMIARSILTTDAYWVWDGLMLSIPYRALLSYYPEYGVPFTEELYTDVIGKNRFDAAMEELVAKGYVKINDEKERMYVYANPDENI